MLFGNTQNGTTDGESTDLIKEVIREGKAISRFSRQEELRLVGEAGHEIKDITAHFFSLLKKYESGETQIFGIMADNLDPKTGKICRIKMITEKQERV